MARPRKHELRDHQLNLALTQREMEVVRARAAAAGTPPVDYARRLLLQQSQAAETSDQVRTERLLHEQLKRLGNNLNQVVRMQNLLRVPAPADLQPLLQEIRQLIARGFARDRSC